MIGFGEKCLIRPRQLSSERDKNGRKTTGKKSVSENGRIRAAAKKSEKKKRDGTPNGKNRVVKKTDRQKIQMEKRLENCGKNSSDSVKKAQDKKKLHLENGKHIQDNKKIRLENGKIAGKNIKNTAQKNSSSHKRTTQTKKKGGR